VPDMRWGIETISTPWYRSALLWRQTRGGEWGPVLDRVAARLRTLIQREAA